jgi:hypothetical protein
VAIRRGERVKHSVPSAREDDARDHGDGGDGSAPGASTGWRSYRVGSW